MNILKRVLGVIAGVAVGLAFVMIGDYCSGLIQPWPNGLDYHSRDAIAAFMAPVPVSAFVAMLVFYALGAFLGGLVATLVTGREALRPAMTVGILLTIGSIMNQMDIPHPIWFMILAVLICIPFAWSGWRVSRKVR